MRKRFVTTAITLIMVLICIFAFAGCSDDGKVQNKKYLLSDITLTFDSSVSEEIKTGANEIATGILNDAKTAEVFFNFYASTRFATNYNGTVLFGTCKQADDGTLTVTDDSTSKDISLKIENKQLILTEKKSGVTADFKFDFSEKIDFDNLDLTDLTLHYVTLYYSFSDKIAENAKPDFVENAQQRNNDYMGSYFNFKVDTSMKAEKGNYRGNFKAKINNNEFGGTFLVSKADGYRKVELKVTQGENKLNLDSLVFYDINTLAFGSATSDGSMNYCFMSK